MKLRSTVIGMTVATAAIAGGPAAAQTAPPPWKMTLSTDSSYFFYRTNRPALPLFPAQALRERGSQFQQSLGVQLTGHLSPDFKLSVMVKTGYISARNTRTAGVTTNSGSYSGMLDSVVSSTVTYLGFSGFQPFISLNANLPTGKSNNSASGGQGKGDADLVPRATFGEGLNFGPTIGVNIPITPSLISTFSVGHTLRGKFKREADIIPPFLFPISINPGDVTTATATLAWAGEKWNAKGSLAYSTETETTYNAVPFYRAGDRIVVQLATGYAIDDNWSWNGKASYSHFNRNRVQTFGLPPLVAEAFNSNNDIITLGTGVTYARDNWSLGPTLSFTHRAKNGWDPTTFQFVTSRDTWSVGVAGAVTVAERVQIKANAARIWGLERATPDKAAFGFPIAGTGTAAARTNAWQASASASIQF